MHNMRAATSRVEISAEVCLSVDLIFLFSSVPDWLIWLKYLSWFLYGNEALAINQVSMF